MSCNHLWEEALIRCREKFGNVVHGACATCLNEDFCARHQSNKDIESNNEEVEVMEKPKIEIGGQSLEIVSSSIKYDGVYSFTAKKGNECPVTGETLTEDTKYQVIENEEA